MEVYQRIEAALKITLGQHPVEKDEVMIFKPRVEEAQRHARNEMKTLIDDRGNRGSVLKGNKKRGAAPPPGRRDNMDAEEG